MIEKFSGNLEDILKHLWSDERVDELIQQDWYQLCATVEENSAKVGDCIRTFCRLLNERQETEVEQYVESLPQFIMDCLLVELAREMHFLKEHEGVVLH